MKETSRRRRGIDTSDDGGVAPHDMGCAQIPEMGSDDLAEYSLRLSSLHNTKELRSIVMPQIDAMGSAKNPAGWSYPMNEEAVDVLAQFGKVFDRNTGRIENGRPVDREDWQQIYAIFGVAGCGKSLLVDIFQALLALPGSGPFYGEHGTEIRPCESHSMVPAEGAKFDLGVLEVWKEWLSHGGMEFAIKHHQPCIRTCIHMILCANNFDTFREDSHIIRCLIAMMCRKVPKTRDGNRTLVRRKVDVQGRRRHRGDNARGAEDAVHRVERRVSATLRSPTSSRTGPTRSWKMSAAKTCI